MSTTKATMAVGKNAHRVSPSAKVDGTKGVSVKLVAEQDAWQRFGTIGYDAYVKWVMNGSPAHSPYEMNG